MMQTPQPATPPATQPVSPSAPAVAPVPGAPVIATSQGPQQLLIPVPRTEADIRAIRLQRSELSDQLISANRRRRDLAQELARSDGPARLGLEGRLAVLDQRIVQLESDIAATGRILTSPEAARLMTEQRTESSADEEEAFMGGAAAGVLFGVFMMAIWQRFRRRRRAADLQQAIGHDPAQMARLEQAVDSIAIEVERIAEGQRFTSKLMAESAQRAKSERATI